MTRCYVTDVEDSCEREARYEARLDYTAGVMLLCENHARAERACGGVIWIRSLTARDRETP